MAEDAVFGITRFLGYLIKDIILEGVWDILIRGVGFLILKFGWPPNWRRDVNIDGMAPAVVGVIFWIVILWAFF